MRKPEQKIILERKRVLLGQYGGSEDDTVVGEFETIENQYVKYANAIGSFVISFAGLESSVDIDLAEGINDRSHDLGYRIIKYLSFRDKINLLRDGYVSCIHCLISEPSKGRLLSELGIIHNKLCELSEFRNKVAHANWQSLDTLGFVRTKIIENGDGIGMQMEKIKMTPEVLIKFRKQNEAVANRLDNYRQKVQNADNRGQAKYWRKKQREE